jgi:hypothetical protein
MGPEYRTDTIAYRRMWLCDLMAPHPLLAPLHDIPGDRFGMAPRQIPTVTSNG